MSPHCNISLHFIVQTHIPREILNRLLYNISSESLNTFKISLMTVDSLKTMTKLRNTSSRMTSHNFGKCIRKTLNLYHNYSKTRCCYGHSLNFIEYINDDIQEVLTPLHNAFWIWPVHFVCPGVFTRIWRAFQLMFGCMMEASTPRGILYNIFKTTAHWRSETIDNMRVYNLRISSG